MEEILEEFLRQAAARRKHQAAQQAGPPPQRVPVHPEIVEAELAEPVEPLSERHLDTSDVTAHSQSLGRRAAQADDIMESRVHEVFDHSVSRFDKSTRQIASDYEDIHEQAAGQGPDQAIPLHDAIFQLLRSPTTVRQAIVVNEILKRPEHLW